MDWLITSVWDIAAWALAALVIYRICLEAPMDQVQWPVGLAVHLLGAGMMAMAHLCASALWLGRPLEALFNARFHWNLVVYWAIAAACHAWIYHRTLEREERRALKLEARLAEAELEALRIQLQPHFLFNTLETISALMRRDPDGAERMIARLGDLLRYSLRHSHDHLVTLGEELDHIRRYVEIEQTRFQDRLSVAIEADISALTAPVPVLILQPLVENAVRHGIAKTTQGMVRIRASRAGAMLAIEIADDGPGAAGAIEEGVGLSNTRRRIEQLYRGKGSFKICSRAGGGMVAELALPVAAEAF